MMDNAAGSKPRACVIGWPISHSRSPSIHTYWLDTLKIEGSYTRQAVEPDDLEAFMSRLREGAFTGCNVTIPHKQAVIRHLNAIDSTAEKIGAVNTIWREGSDLIGSNTDMDGFLHNLDAQAPGWDQAEQAIILGAGGAARAVVAGLVERNLKTIIIVNRTVETARSLAAEMNMSHHGIAAVSYDDLTRHLPDTGLLVNATSLGMNGSPVLDIDISRMPEAAVVNDLVYAPLETRLLAQAASRGLKTVDGLGMLLHQAVGGFEKWFGKKPVVDDGLRTHILDAIAGEDDSC